MPDFFRDVTIERRRPSTCPALSTMRLSGRPTPDPSRRSRGFAKYSQRSRRPAPNAHAAANFVIADRPIGHSDETMVKLTEPRSGGYDVSDAMDGCRCEGARTGSVIACLRTGRASMASQTRHSIGRASEQHASSGTDLMVFATMNRSAAGATSARRLLRIVTALFLGAQGACTVAGPPTEVFDRTKLHTVEITVEESYLVTLATDLEDRVPCTLRYDGELIKDAEIRQKGNTLVDLSDKPSFSLKLNDELHGLDKIILNNAAHDPTLLRELLGADTFARVGLSAARVAHAAVKLNDLDTGLYVVVEGIDKGFARRHFDKNSDEGNLYEGPCCGDFVGDIDHMQLDDEKKDNRSRDDLRALAAVIQSASDADLAAEVGKRLDFDQFVTSYALEALLGHWDGYAYKGNNFYLYDNPADGRFVFLPHGMDRILEDSRFDTETAPVALLPRRIRAIPTLDARFRAELQRVVPLAWDEASVLASIDQAAQVIHSSGSGEPVQKDVAAFDTSIADFRDAILLRHDLLASPGVCGNGQPEGLETCDDGNTTGGDGCSAVCRVEP